MQKKTKSEIKHTKKTIINTQKHNTKKTNTNKYEIKHIKKEHQKQ